MKFFHHYTRVPQTRLTLFNCYVNRNVKEKDSSMDQDEDDLPAPFTPVKNTGIYVAFLFLFFLLLFF